MSKIGKKPIHLPQGVTVDLQPDVLVVHGSKGTVHVLRLPGLLFELQDSTYLISKDGKKSHKKADAFWGTQRALLASAVQGVNEGYQKRLEIEGVGYRATLEGKDLVLSLGLSHPVRVAPREGINIAVEKNVIVISGVDKALVGQTAAEIRALKKPEPYKGKGIRYQGEIVRRKSGKKLAGAAG